MNWPWRRSVFIAEMPQAWAFARAASSQVRVGLRQPLASVWMLTTLDLLEQVCGYMRTATLASARQHQEQNSMCEGDSHSSNKKHGKMLHWSTGGLIIRILIIPANTLKTAW